MGGNLLCNGTSSHGMENKLKSPLDWKTLENLTWIAKWRGDSPAAKPTADTIGHAWTQLNTGEEGEKSFT